MNNEHSGRRRANGANGRRRANNTGTLEKHGKAWRARWYAYEADGRRVRLSKTLDAKTLDEARAELRTLADAGETSRGYDRGAASVVPVQPAALPLDELFVAYRASLNRPQCGEVTMKGYGSEIGRFVEWMAERHPGVREVRAVTKEMAGEFLTEMASRFSPNTYNKYANLLKLVWRTVGDEAGCGRNPWDGFRLKRLSRDNGRRPLSVEELTKVFSVLDGELRTLFALGVYTGLRLGDCALMRWQDLDMERRLLVVTPRKTSRTGRMVEVPLHPVLHGLLDSLPAGRRSGYLMPGIASEYRRNPSDVSKRVRDAFEAAGIKTGKTVKGYSKKVAEVGFHSLRHTFVSMMGNAGAPLALVQALVGHSNPMMTCNYFHARTEALADAVGALPAIPACGGTPEGEKGSGGRFCGVDEGMTDCAQEFLAQFAKLSEADKAQISEILRRG